MSNSIYDINVIRNIILESQHLLKKSSDSIENIVSDICGLQYDPNPTIHLNQYMMLWNRKKDFKAEQLTSFNSCRKSICRLFRLQDGLENQKIYY